MDSQPFNQLDQFEFHHTLAETKGIALVLFTSEGCASCRAWQQLLDNYQQHHPAINLYCVDAQRESALIHELEIFHLPAIYLYANGVFHAEIQSEARLSRFEHAIQTALAQPAQEQP
ncbi:MAG: thioredoxin family protein [Gammaproteobacteria bacterium]|nr:thioredoxin family protein [Gammaproteobacteria bacterium]MDH5728369.1 thioredoxin family protein [Gammaproteobacteria bacterium]